MEQEKSLSSNSAKKRKILIGCAIGGMALIMAGTGIGIGYAIWHKKGGGGDTPTPPPAVTSITIINRAAVKEEYTWHMDSSTTKPSSMPELMCQDSNGHIVTATYSISGQTDLTGAGLSFSTTSGNITGTPNSTLDKTSFTITATYQGFTDTVNTHVEVLAPLGSYNIDGTNWPGYVSGGWTANDYIIDETNKKVTYGGAHTKSYAAEDFTVPDKVFCNDDEYDVVIGDQAFDYTSTGVSLAGKLTISDGIESIGVDAFLSCSNLTGGLTIPDTVTTIGDGAFYICSGLTGRLTIGNSVTTIGNGAFNGCSGLTGELTIPDSMETILSSAFLNCSGLTGRLTIGNSVTTIEDYAFNACTGFNTIIASFAIEPTIGSSAFGGWQSAGGMVYNTNNNYASSDLLDFLVDNCGLPSSWSVD